MTEVSVEFWGVIEWPLKDKVINTMMAIKFSEIDSFVLIQSWRKKLQKQRQEIIYIIAEAGIPMLKNMFDSKNGYWPIQCRSM